jgi:hypothetical protein
MAASASVLPKGGYSIISEPEAILSGGSKPRPERSDGGQNLFGGRFAVGFVNNLAYSLVKFEAEHRRRVKWTARGRSLPPAPQETRRKMRLTGVNGSGDPSTQSRRRLRDVFVETLFAGNKNAIMPFS